MAAWLAASAAGEARNPYDAIDRRASLLYDQSGMAARLDFIVGKIPLSFFLFFPLTAMRWDSRLGLFRITSNGC